MSGLQVEIFAGQLMEGACVSMMVKLVVQEELFPAKSVAVMVITWVPETRFVPGAGCWDSEYPVQLSVTVAREVRLGSNA